MTIDTTFRFDPSRLQPLGNELADHYRTALPFPHAVIDDFLPATVLQEVLDEFPGVDHDAWWRFDSERERKLGSPDQSMMGPATRLLFDQFNGPMFIDFLTELTGIDGLVPDPHLFGGGLHQIEPGGYLDVHADFNLHPQTRLERRLNVLLYLNPNWQESWGGALELWARDMSRCVERILPVFNRCVVFSTTDTSFHGHPAPLASPQGTTRRSLALYYYSLPTAPAAAREHNTLFPRYTPTPTPDARRMRRVVGQLLPPAAVRILRAARAPGMSQRGDEEHLSRPGEEEHSV